MSNTLLSPRPSSSGSTSRGQAGKRQRLRATEEAPRAAMDTDAVRNAYRRWAGIYDLAFGHISGAGRREAVSTVNRLPGKDVLEVGVGTGLALPHYTAEKKVTGIDLSTEMLQIARERVQARRLRNVTDLLEQDAEATDFADASFDIAVAMFVASVVPNPRKLMAEMRRVVRPGGHILFINHFAAERGPRWWVERTMAPASHALGWPPDFALGALFSPADLAAVTLRPVRPFGLFTLAQLKN
jgi:phosphatidylethanolamine/phosphatidyl-N-methylethanolamine N-methyltransferase